MSRGQLARTPENFPRMKHRAAGRLARKKAAMLPPGDFFRLAAEAIERGAKALQIVIDGVAQMLTGKPKRTDFVLMPPPTFHPLTMTVSQDQQQKMDAMLIRSHSLAIQRGHIKR